MKNSLIIYSGNNTQVNKLITKNCDQRKIEFRVLEGIDKIDVKYAPDLTIIFFDFENKNLLNFLQSSAKLKRSAGQKRIVIIAIFNDIHALKKSSYIFGSEVDFAFVSHNYNDYYIDLFFNFIFDDKNQEFQNKSTDYLELSSTMEFVEVKSISPTKIHFKSKTKINMRRSRRYRR